MNRKRTHCADGTTAAECHAFRLDFGPSGITPERAAAFENKSFAPKHGLVRGRLVKRPAGSFREDVLVVEEAWEGQAQSTPRGSFEKLTATGRLCITFPCDSYQGERLNVGTVNLYNAVDLAASGAPADAVAQGNAALHDAGILAAGVAVPIVGPAGRGQDFAASEFYLRVPPGPQRCGSRGLPACAEDQYCDFPDGSRCGADDSGGVCQPRPQICPAIFDPVCGCDGQTYSSACVAAGNGVDVASEGECESPERPCASSESCNPGEVCTTEDGVCNPPPGCGPGVVCPAVCYGTCRPAAGGACRTDADCRTFSDYCTGCDCRALSVDQKDPVCPGPGVQCFVDPCMNQTAICLAGRCAIASK